MEHHSEISEHYEQTKDSRNFQREKLLTYKIQKVKKNNGFRPCNSITGFQNSMEQYLQSQQENLFENQTFIPSQAIKQVKSKIKTFSDI